MASLGISLQQIVGTPQNNNVNIPGGTIKSGNLSFHLKSTGSYGSLEELRQTAITSIDSQIVYLKNIATVSYDYEDIHVPEAITKLVNLNGFI